MINIAIIAGGPSAERGVSLKSAKTVAKHLPSEKYSVTTIDITPKGWKDIDTGATVDLNRFCIPESDGQPLKVFDFAFIIIHGTPAEDGRLQGYLDMMGVPHSGCNVLTSALTFNKQMCKDHLKPYNIPMAESMIVTGLTSAQEVQQRNITLPLFVKPNNNGSSYGVTKVKTWDQLETAIRHALDYDHEVMIERALEGKEFSCGVVREGATYHVLPITEIIPKGEFFDFAAKYEGESQEITPARLDASLAAQCQDISGGLYKLLGCRGMVRFDYILEDGTFYLLEANTTPGMSEASIIPQQANAYGWTIGKLLDVVVTDCLANKH
ncbi:MAG: D-alanine--D-alanine ligase family protein [Saprospiraceae bacterium]|nr:D-alanine--D-alanine ligase family protein [Saprospiraceae bacterium]